MFRGVSLRRSAKWCRWGLWRMPCRTAFTSAWPWRPRRGISSRLWRAVEAALQLAVRRHPDPAAVRAEVVAHRGDEPHRPQRPGEFIPPGHALGLDGRQLRHPLQDGFSRQKAAPIPLGAGPHGHELDEPHLPGTLPAEVHKIYDLIVVEPADEDGVEFQVMESRRLRGFDAVQHILEGPQPGHGGKPARTQGVQADVQPVHSRILPAGAGGSRWW